MSNKGLYALSLSLLICFAACSKTETPTTPEPDTTTAPAPVPAAPAINVGTITLGKAVGPDKKVTTATEKFAKGDTIYASVDTTGTGTATLKAKWTFTKDGTVVNEETQTIMPTGPATTEFHVSKPGGWPAGDYQVEVFVDDMSVGTKTFTIA